ncbi:hypothetical protein B0H14DRAFT_2638802 [Mycena olivaceomarginata]|nr:hypothetical protein B0H14DRAFT_2638802 [Mycena olivaceomarginata]
MKQYEHPNTQESPGIDRKPHNSTKVKILRILNPLSDLLGVKSNYLLADAYTDSQMTQPLEKISSNPEDASTKDLKDYRSLIPPAVDNIPPMVPSSQILAKSLVSKGQWIKITRQLKVDNLFYFTTVPPTFDVPRTPTAILLDLSGSTHLLKKADGNFVSVDRFIQTENQESWDGSGAHAKGDAWVQPPIQMSDSSVALFVDLERFEADENAMRELWNHELDQNEAEAASPSVARFYNRIQSSKCKIQCDGVPVMVRLTHASSAYGKQYFIGCSKWKRSETGSHLYWPMPPNVDEDVLRFVMENEGRLPTGPAEMNHHCVLTVHPRVGLTHCPYSHIIDGKIKPPGIEHRLCPSRMIIYVPVEDSPATRHKAIVVLENPHNHPINPTSKRSTEDKLKLKTAVNAAGVNGLTVQKLLNAPSTLSAYNGKRVEDSSPVFVDTRKVRDFISVQKKLEHPHGFGWEDGALYSCAMSKNGFRLVVTMHPQIATLIHKILSLNIDFTFKRVDGKMYEWEVVGLVDRVKKRERFKLAPFYPDARCRIVMLDGHIDELPQHIPKPVIVRLKSIMGLKTQQEIDEWHEFFRARDDPEIKSE